MIDSPGHCGTICGFIRAMIQGLNGLPLLSRKDAKSRRKLQTGKLQTPKRKAAALARLPLFTRIFFGVWSLAFGV